MITIITGEVELLRKIEEEFLDGDINNGEVINKHYYLFTQHFGYIELEIDKEPDCTEVDYVKDPPHIIDKTSLEEEKGNNCGSVLIYIYSFRSLLSSGC